MFSNKLKEVFIIVTFAQERKVLKDCEMKYDIMHLR